MLSTDVLDFIREFRTSLEYCTGPSNIDCVSCLVYYPNRCLGNREARFRYMSTTRSAQFKYSLAAVTYLTGERHRAVKDHATTLMHHATSILLEGALEGTSSYSCEDALFEAGAAHFTNRSDLYPCYQALTTSLNRWTPIISTCTDCSRCTQDSCCASCTK